MTQLLAKPKMNPLNVLIIGRSEEMVISLLDVLSSAGFDCDCISTRKCIRIHNLINNFYYVKDNNELLRKSVSLSESQPYDLIVITDDKTIKLFLDSDLSMPNKSKLLPVVDESHFGHLASKIGLSRALYNSNVHTPDFAIVHTKLEILNHLDLIKFPFILKGDFSSGGNQTIEVNDQNELETKIKSFNFFPAVMQKKIDGELIGIEALFIEKKLIHFSYAKVLKTIANNKFSPSALREYSQLGVVDKEIFQELAELGQALGINGFVNISCIRSNSDDLHYYFEADVRPTTWLGYTKYFGDSLGARLSKHLNSGEVLSYPVKINMNYPMKVRIPYCLRFTTFELLSNRHSVWKFIPKNRLVFYLLTKKHLLRRLESLLTLRLARRSFKNYWYN